MQPNGDYWPAKDTRLPLECQLITVFVQFYNEEFEELRVRPSA